MGPVGQGHRNRAGLCSPFAKERLKTAQVWTCLVSDPWSPRHLTEQGSRCNRLANKEPKEIRAAPPAPGSPASFQTTGHLVTAQYLSRTHHEHSPSRRQVPGLSLGITGPSEPSGWGSHLSLPPAPGLGSSPPRPPGQ